MKSQRLLDIAMVLVIIEAASFLTVALYMTALNVLGIILIAIPAAVLVLSLSSALLSIRSKPGNEHDNTCEEKDSPNDNVSMAEKEGIKLDCANEHSNASGNYALHPDKSSIAKISQSTTRKENREGER